MFAEVDDCDAHLAELKWFVVKDERRMYVATASNESGSGLMYMHAMVLGKKAGYVIDHIDCNGLNNTIANLRFVTVAQNAANARLSARNKTGVKGLSIERNGRYQYIVASIMSNGKKAQKRFFLSQLEEATAWINNKRSELHGEFANHGHAR